MARSARWSSPTCRSCPTPRPTRPLENAGIFLREAGAQAVKVEGGVRTRPGHRDPGPCRHPGHGPHRPDAAVDQHGRQGPGPGQDPGAGAVAHRRRARGPGGRRLLDGPRARPGAARRGHHRAPAHPDDRDRRRRRMQRPGPGHHRPHRPRRLHPKHARPYAHLREQIRDAATAYAADVAAGTFPGPAETVRMDDAILDEVLGRGAPIARPARSRPAASRSIATSEHSRPA